jgi:DNA adenine methylase
MQHRLFESIPSSSSVSQRPFRKGLLKWIGNKQRFAHEIVLCFPYSFQDYHEPFLGSGAVLGALSPRAAIGSDAYKPLIDIWITLKNRPAKLKEWYADRWNFFMSGERVEAYESIKKAFNASPNAADLLFLSRSCYGGVVRFRKADGYMSTPCGVHKPISPESFSERVDEWHKRVSGTEFEHLDFRQAMRYAKERDIIYCDPPYSHTQTILYGAQSFNLRDLFEEIGRCKDKGVYVVLSIDGTKKSGDYVCDLPIPKGLFEEEIQVSCGRSMLKRFQMNGKTLVGEDVHDRLLLTYKIE